MMDVDALPSRSHQVASLRGSVDKPYDVIVVGGGATGVGCAMDAASRGLSVALVERGDFASGTSSKSTKLIHGGVRYLEKAFFNLDYGQYKLVREALHERNVWMDIAPHLSSWWVAAWPVRVCALGPAYHVGCHRLPIMLPVFKWWQVPYFYAGVKAYDLVSGFEGKKHSFLLGKSATLEQFPMLRRNKLKASLVCTYLLAVSPTLCAENNPSRIHGATDFDGHFNDSRACTAFALTAACQGATVSNYINVEGVLKDAHGAIEGVMARDMRDKGGEAFPIMGRTVINATGPFTDGLRQLDDPATPTITAPSSGTHLTLPDYYSPRVRVQPPPVLLLPHLPHTLRLMTHVARVFQAMGMLDPATSDGRVIFMLPWEGRTIAGTTDTACQVTKDPKPTEEDVRFILKEVRPAAVVVWVAALSCPVFPDPRLPCTRPQRAPPRCAVSMDWHSPLGLRPQRQEHRGAIT